MLKNITTLGSFLGYKKNGAPFYLIGGGDETVDPGNPGPTTTPAPPAPEVKYFTAEDIERARQEEKEKLYGRISKQDDRFKAMEDELGTLRQEREAKEAEEQRRQQEAAQLAKTEAEKELSAKELFEKREQEMRTEWESKFNKLEQENAARAAANEKEREFLALQSYINDQVSAAADDIAPELLDFVGGNTKEEVDASIANVKAKTDAIVKNMTEATQQVRAQQRGVSPAGFATTGPLDTNSHTQTYTAEELAAMPMSEYAKLRSQIGIGNSHKDRGIFG